MKAHEYNDFGITNRLTGQEYFEFGLASETGTLEVPKNSHRALLFYLEALTQGHSEAQQKVLALKDQQRSLLAQPDTAAVDETPAEIYSEIGIRLLYRDPSLAFLNHKRAADKGHLKAAYWVGLAYEWGREVEIDYATALHYYLKAADQGHKESQVAVGMMYFKGLGVPQDYPIALEWFQKGVAQGYVTAQQYVDETKAKIRAANPPPSLSHYPHFLAAKKARLEAKAAKSSPMPTPQ